MSNELTSGKDMGWKKCPTGSAICGFRAILEENQGYFLDDTALHDLEF